KAARSIYRPRITLGGDLSSGAIRPPSLKSKSDISTLLKRGHFYFALTNEKDSLEQGFGT
ncbi:MAG TPA: hypothetical protein VLR90_18220, partial [Blastocatellia bacterium]|nr:hypothetical protein [Blastocatellia bacterium]